MCLFDLKYALSSCPGQLLESGVKSKRHKVDRSELQNFKNLEISFLTRIFGRVTPIQVNLYASSLLLLFLNIVHGS